MPEREEVPQEEVARLRAEADGLLDDLTRPPSREELVEGLRRAGLDLWVKQFVLNVQLAVELYPEEVRAAFKGLYDVTAAEQRLAQVVALLNRTEKKLADMLEASAWAERDLAPSLNSMLAQVDRIETASRFVAGLNRRVAALEKKLTTALDFMRGLVMWAQGKGFRPMRKAAQPQKGHHGERRVQGPAAGEPGSGQAGR
jgi:hypothetical protein